MSTNGSQPSGGISYTALGVAVGLIFGVIIGIIIDNMVIFAGGGMVLGLAIGSALDRGKGDRT